MTYETKNITFHVIRVKVSSDSWCSRTSPMNVAIESAHCGCERNSCKDWTRSKRCGKHGRIWSKAEHCIKVWYSGSQTCLGQSVHSRPISSLVPQHLVSHSNSSEPSRMEAMVLITDNGMGSNIYWCVWFPCSAKNRKTYQECCIRSYDGRQWVEEPRALLPDAGRGSRQCRSVKNNRELKNLDMCKSSSVRYTESDRERVSDTNNYVYSKWKSQQ